MAFNYNELEAVTREYFYPKLVDQIFSKDPILSEIKKRKKTVDGGRMFSVNIKVDTLNRGKFTPNATFNVDKKEIINRVDMPVKGHYSNLTIDGFEEAQTKGKAAILNLLSSKIEDLEEAMRQELLDALYFSATKDTAGTGFQGLETIVDDNNTYAGLDRTQHEFWQAKVIEDATGTAPITLDYKTLRDFYMSVSDGGKDARNLVFVGDFTTVGKIEEILATRNQIQSRDSGLANLGFEAFTLFGKKCYSSSELEEHAKTSGEGVLYAINFDYMTMHTLNGYDFKLTKFKEDRDSEMKSRQLITMGNFVATKPKRLGVIKNIELA